MPLEGKGETSTNHQFLGSMLVFGGVPSCKQTCNGNLDHFKKYFLLKTEKKYFSQPSHVLWLLRLTYPPSEIAPSDIRVYRLCLQESFLEIIKANMQSYMNPTGKGIPGNTYFFGSFEGIMVVVHNP